MALPELSRVRFPAKSVQFLENDKKNRSSHWSLESRNHSGSSVGVRLLSGYCVFAFQPSQLTSSEETLFRLIALNPRNTCCDDGPFLLHSDLCFPIKSVEIYECKLKELNFPSVTPDARTRVATMMATASSRACFPVSCKSVEEHSQEENLANNSHFTS